MPSKRSSQPNPLPKRDHNAKLQTLSLRAFQAALPIDKFQYRDERTDDAGVDATIELLINSDNTNQFSQVQLKSTDSQAINSDGSVSLQVKASNLNYLLNGSSPLYVLYIAPRNELRYVWARDEFRRLNDSTPNWMNQKTVTLRFERLLTPAALDEIHSRILKEASLERGIHELLGRSIPTERIIVSVNPETLRPYAYLVWPFGTGKQSRFLSLWI